MGDLEHIKKGDYQSFVTKISETYSDGFQKTVTAINSNMVETYWKNWSTYC